MENGDRREGAVAKHDGEIVRAHCAKSCEFDREKVRRERESQNEGASERTVSDSWRKDQKIKRKAKKVGE